MGMSTYIKAFIPDNDPEYQKHLRIYNMCKSEKVSLPKETAAYFNDDTPEDKLALKLNLGVHYKIYQADMEDGFEVDLTKLPKEVKTIRFVNSY